MSRASAGYRSYLAYVELRRRIRRKLANPNLLYIHVGLYAVVLGVFVAAFNPSYSFYIYRMEWMVTAFFGLWTGLLALHGTWVWLRGGSSNARENAIEQEMRRVYEQYDAPLGDSVDFFALHGLLQQDIGRRYDFSNLLAVLLWANVFSWGLWLFQTGGSNLYPYVMTPIYAFILLPIMMFFLWRKRRFDEQVREMVQQWTLSSLPTTEKSKRVPVYTVEEYDYAPAEQANLTLAEDGELVAESDAYFPEKRKR